MSLTHHRDSIVSLLVTLAREQPDLPLYTFLLSGQDKTDVLTCRQLLLAAQKIAGNLCARNLSGEPVMVLNSYGPAFLETVFGAMLAGCPCVPVTFHARLGMANISSIIARTGLRIVVGNQDVLTQFRAGRCRTNPRFIDARHQLEYLATDALQHIQGELPTISDTEVAVLYPGVASDEELPLVSLSHADMLRSAEGLVQALSLNTDDRLLTCLDLADGLALALHILVPLQARLPSLLLPIELALADAASWVMAASTFSCTIVSAPVAVLTLAARNGELTGNVQPDLSAIRMICVSGERSITPALISHFIDQYGNNGISADKLFCCLGLSSAGSYLAGRLGFKTLVKNDIAYLALGVSDARGLRATVTGSRWIHIDNELCCTGRINHRFTVSGRTFQAEDIEAFILQVFGERGLSRCVALRIDEIEQTVLLAECASKQLAEHWQGVVPTMIEQVQRHTGCRLDRVIILRPGSLFSAVSGIVHRQSCADALLDGSMLLRLLPVRGK
ncbi:AMP-binding protein [Pseudohongiella acticola]|jgi:acyl-CoA synthetase (AMP-forming)/AMP-acid ligase II|uniref:AMP-binding protein n=1 Tax=Pseudohongiella acticola TaxID=1524254 RepID=UPI0030EDBB3E